MGDNQPGLGKVLSFQPGPFYGKKNKGDSIFQPVLVNNFSNIFKSDLYRQKEIKEYHTRC